MQTNEPRKIEWSEPLREFLAQADPSDWESLVVNELETEGSVLSFRPGDQGQWREGHVSLMVKRGQKRLLSPVQIDEAGRMSADLSEVEGMIRSEKDKSAGVYLAAEDETGGLMGWQLLGGGLRGKQKKEEYPGQSSMLMRQICRHMRPVARRMVSTAKLGRGNPLELCAQPYLQLNTGKLMIQFTTVERAERMAGERWTQSREEYHGDDRYQLSVVLTVDAGGAILREAINSLLKQEWSFQEHIQLILCDLGTAEEGSAICAEYQAKYPHNVVVVDAGGCTGAQGKNLGMAQATGKYLVIMSAYHRFSPDACGAAFHFAEQGYQSADVFVMPTVMSGAQIKDYWRNSWLKVPKMVDLEDTADYVQCTLAASFLKREVAERYRFEAEEAEGGDTLFLLKIFLEKCSIGVNHQGKSIYYCSNKEKEPKAWEYAKDPAWYDRYFDNLPGGILDYAQEKLGWVPDFLSRYLITELMWRFRQKEMPPELEGQEEAYRARLQEALGRIDDRLILAVKKNLTPFELIQIFTVKYGCEPWIDYRWHDAMLRIQGTTIGSLGLNPATVDFIEIERGRFSMEGFIQLPVTVDPERVSVWLRAGSQWLSCTRPPRKMADSNFLGKLFHFITFYGEASITEELFGEEITLYYAIDGHLIRCRYLALKKYCPINSYFPSQYYYKDGVVLTKNRSALMLRPCHGLQERMRYEEAYLDEVRATIDRLPEYHPLAQVDVEQVARLREKAIRHRMCPRHSKIWLVSDRINRGDDNGEIFFQYMQKEQKKWGRKVYFVLEKDCEDYERIRKTGPVISVLSEEHKLKHLMAEWVISSQANDPVLRPFGGETMLYQDLCHDFKFAFLQHGVIKDDLSGWLNRYNRKMEGFVVTTKPEYDSILEYDYYQPPENVWLTGLPRHDALYHDEKKYITIMPTWRKSLTKGLDPVTSVWLVVDDFESSDYYQFYNGLLNNKKLLDRAEEQGYTLCFKPHPNVLPVINRFQRDPRVIFFEESKSYREVYAQSSLILTDYSSAIFDFVLMGKPVIYAQFDAADFFNGSHSYVEGYYDYQRDGFGEVEHNLEDTVNRIIEYMERDCQVKPLYQERIQHTFAFHDKNNSKRVYEKILEHSDPKM